MWDCSKPERGKQFVFLFTIRTSLFNKLSMVICEPHWISHPGKHGFLQGQQMPTAFQKKLQSNINHLKHFPLNPCVNRLKVPAAVVVNCVTAIEHSGNLSAPAEVWLSERIFFSLLFFLFNLSQQLASCTNKEVGRVWISFFSHSLINCFHHSLSLFVALFAFEELLSKSRPFYSDIYVIITICVYSDLPSLVCISGTLLLLSIFVTVT